MPGRGRGRPTWAAADDRGLRDLTLHQQTPAALSPDPPVAALGACAVLGAALFLAPPLVATLGLGPLSRHMTLHIFVMDVLAPIAAVAAGASVRARIARGASSLAPATIAHLAVLWTWHAPAALEAAMASPAAGLAMRLSLFAVATWFWTEVLARRGIEGWRSILALLVTAKLFCLLGAVLVFAPRVLYSGDATNGAPALADQQLAGLLMLAACPLTYVLAGIVIAARWLLEIESSRTAASGGRAAGAL